VIPALKESITEGKYSMLMDAGLMHGRQSRVGWADGWTLVHNGGPLCPPDGQWLRNNSNSLLTVIFNRLLLDIKKPDNQFLMGPSLKTSLVGSDFQVSLEKVVAPVEYESVSDQGDHLEALLEIQLKHSEITDEDTACPSVQGTPGVSALHRYADMSSTLGSGRLDAAGEVWSLCVALWGEVPRPAGQDSSGGYWVSFVVLCFVIFISFTDDPDGYIEQLVRKEALSSWLESVTEKEVQLDILRANKEQVNLENSCLFLFSYFYTHFFFQGLSSALAVFAYLTGRCLDDACSRAQEAGDHTVALLSAQATGAEIGRHMLRTQLDQWLQTKVGCMPSMLQATKILI
jgi:hypothetical protein